MSEPTKSDRPKRISVITNAKGQVIATDFRMSSGPSYGDGPVQSRLIPLKGQRLHELDLPTDMELPAQSDLDSAVVDFHKYLEPLVRSASGAKPR
jgi:hypothetical protein